MLQETDFIRKKSLWLILFGLILYVVHIFFAAYSSRIFYPDGSIYVITILEHGKTIWWHWHRYFAYLIQHFPIVSLVNFDILDIKLISQFHSGWYHSFAAISLAICFFSTQKENRKFLIFPLMGIFAIYINTEFFPITPGRFLTAIYWALVFLMLFTRNIYGIILILILSFPTLRAYQGMLFFGPFLAYLAYWKYRNNINWTKWLFLFLVLWYTGGTVIAIVSILQPQDPTSFITFILGILLFVDEELYPHIPLIVSFILLFVFIKSILKPSVNEKRKRIFDNVFIILAVFVAICPIIFPEGMAFETQQQVRSLNIYFNLGLGILMFLTVNGKIKIDIYIYKRFFNLIGMLIIAQSLWHIQASYQWMKYLEIVKNEMRTKDDGLILFEETSLVDMNKNHNLSNGIHNDWAIGYLSILINEDKDIRNIIAHSYDNIFRPFDPRDSSQLPDLSKYGINFNRYLKGLEGQGELIIPDRPLPEILKWFETNSVGVNDYFEENK